MVDLLLLYSSNRVASTRARILIHQVKHRVGGSSAGYSIFFNEKCLFHEDDWGEITRPLNFEVLGSATENT
jgi:hypothetical protein